MLGFQIKHGPLSFWKNRITDEKKSRPVLMHISGRGDSNMTLPTAGPLS